MGEDVKYVTANRGDSKTLVSTKARTTKVDNCIIFMQFGHRSLVQFDRHKLGLVVIFMAQLLNLSVLQTVLLISCMSRRLSLTKTMLCMV